MFRLPEDTLLRLVARLNGLLYQERGQTLAEYGLIVTLVGVGITILALLAFRTQFIAAYDSMSNCLSGSC